MQMRKLMRAEKRKGTIGHGWNFNGNEQVTIPRKGRVRSPMPVREARQRGFVIARRIQQSKIDAMIRRRLHWEMIARNSGGWQPSTKFEKSAWEQAAGRANRQPAGLTCWGHAVCKIEPINLVPKESK